MRRFLFALVLLARCSALSPLSFGQAQSSIIVGTVVDARRHGAERDSHREERGHRRELHGVANSAGDYRLNNVPVGRYDVTVTAKGFTTATTAGVECS